MKLLANRQSITFFLICSLLLCAFSPAHLGASTLRLAWDPNTEDDLAGYNVHYGTQSMEYDFVINVGNAAQHTVMNLEPEVRYYFAVTAYDTSGNESDFSVEVSGIPESPPDPDLDPIKITSPNGGETLKSSTMHTITWTTHNTPQPGAKTILLYTESGRKAWNEIVVLTGNPGRYDWVVPNVRGTKRRCIVMVVLKDARGNLVDSDASDSNFTISSSHK